MFSLHLAPHGHVRRRSPRLQSQLRLGRRIRPLLGRKRLLRHARLSSQCAHHQLRARHRRAHRDVAHAVHLHATEHLEVHAGHVHVLLVLIPYPESISERVSRRLYLEIPGLPVTGCAV